MKLKKVMAVAMAATMVVSLAGCGSKADAPAADGDTATEAGDAETGDAETGDTADDAGSEDTAADGLISYSDLKLGEDLTDLTATITLFNHRTDLQNADMPNKQWDEYLADFNQMYPNITVEVTTDTDYAESALLRLQGGDWGDIMMIPAVDAADLSTYFLSYGDLETLQNEVRFADQWSYDGQVYGIPSTGTAQGVVYNKKVFEEAGVTELPKTPDEFIAALKAIKDKFGDEVVPLYTNYAAGWTMGAWDAYIGGTATGDPAFQNQKMLHMSNPFADQGNGAGVYNVYKILYDAVAQGLTEDDYTTTDWEGCKGMINSGKIGCMVLGSWAFPQMRDAGENGDDIGYFSFPITVDGKQYASAGPDYNFGINVNADETNQQASLIFVKWMTEKSGFSYNEGGLPISLSDNNYPDVYSAFDGIEMVANEPSVAGEEDLLNNLNADSELNFNAGGDAKVQAIIEHAANGDMSYDDIIAEWNQKWTDAQATEGVEITE